MTKTTIKKAKPTASKGKKTPKKSQTIAAPMVPSYPKENQDWFSFDLGLPNIAYENALDWMKDNCVYKDDEGGPYLRILDATSEQGYKRNRMILNNLFKKADGKGVSVETGNVDSHRFISNKKGLWHQKSSEGVNLLVVTATEMAAKIICPAWLMRNSSILYSKQGGDDQGIHRDDPRSKEDRKRQGEMASVLISVIDGTKINNFEGKKSNHKRVIEIPKGHCIVYGGRQMHSGCGYHNNNARIHLYLGPKTLVPNNTIQPIYECSECEKVHYTSGALRNHRWRYHKKMMSVPMQRLLLRATTWEMERNKI